MSNIELINFIKEKFPKCAIEIRESLELLQSAIDTTIDSIEDKSSELIKKDRNFKEGNSYREKSQSMYEISMKIQEYIESVDLEEIDEADEETDDVVEKVNQTVNYSEYYVDNNIEHNIYEDYTNKRPFAFKLKDKKVEVKDWKDMLVETANVLSEIDKNIIDTFPDNPKMNGKKVIYFSYEHKPTMRAVKKLKHLDIYLDTCHSANQIRNIVINMLRQYNISLSEFKIYLKADYSERH